MIRLLKTATLVLALVYGSMGGMVWASADSQPGSPLYPVRLAVEEIRLAVHPAMTTDEVAEPQLQMDFARERAEEMQAEEMRAADGEMDGACQGGNCGSEMDGACQGGNCGSDQSSTCQGGNCGSDQDNACQGGNCGSEMDSTCQGGNCDGEMNDACQGGNCGSDQSSTCQGGNCDSNQDGEHHDGCHR
jgi:hypothetical protein